MMIGIETGPVFAAAVFQAEFADTGSCVLLYRNEQGHDANCSTLRYPRV